MPRLVNGHKFPNLSTPHQGLRIPQQTLVRASASSARLILQTLIVRPVQSRFDVAIARQERPSMMCFCFAPLLRRAIGAVEAVHVLKTCFRLFGLCLWVHTLPHGYLSAITLVYTHTPTEARRAVLEDPAG